MTTETIISIIGLAAVAAWWANISNSNKRYMEINADGSVAGKTFSGAKYIGGYPHVKPGQTYARYRQMVDEEFRPKGFHLGDLSWGDWQTYCMGSGQFAGVDSNDFIS